MQISNSAITMVGQHQATQQTRSSLAMRVWVGDTPPPPLPSPGQTPPARPPLHDEVTLSPEARQKQRTENEACGCKKTKNAEDMVSDPEQRMVVLLLQKVFGMKFKILDVAGEAQETAETLADQPPPQQTDGNANEGWGFELHMEESYYEAEQMSFAAQGRSTRRTAKRSRSSFNCP
ncbi:MAG: hypothetical protein R2873_34255 [Caldilineaceae bacterium]